MTGGNLTGGNAPDGLSMMREGIGQLSMAPMMELVGVALTQVEPGRVVMRATPRPDFNNQHARMHGGYAAILLDTACGGAVISRLAADQYCLTLEMKVAYLDAISVETGEIEIIGSLQRMGRSVAFAEAEIRVGKGNLLASATSTLTIKHR